VFDVIAWMEGEKAGSDRCRNRRRKRLRHKSFERDEPVLLARNSCGWVEASDLASLSF